MNSFLASLPTLVPWLLIAMVLLALILLVILLLWLLPRREKETQQALLSEIRRSGEREERLVMLLAAKGPMEFQAMAAMATGPSGYDAFDPSDEGELERIGHRNPERVEEEGPNGYEESFFAEVGIDPELFGGTFGP